MPDGRIGVGIVGMEPGRSWSATAHAPALQALPEYEITAISTTRMQSAEASAAAFGIPNAFDNHEELVRHPDVDLVAVTVKVPGHFDIVRAALDAGKMIYCEWPLGNGLDEAIAMRDHAERTGVRGFVGLQGRVAPVVAYVRDLVRDGYVGDVLSTSMVASTGGWGAESTEQGRYLLDRANGATMMTIPFGHNVDAMCHALGELDDVISLGAIRRPSVTVAGTGEIVTKTAEDQIVLGGTLQSGAIASVHFRGGIKIGTGVLWEINGTEGVLQVVSNMGHMQITQLSLMGGKAGGGIAEMPVPEKYRQVPEGLTGGAVNMALAYKAVAEDIANGTHRFPDFSDGVVRHRMIAAVEEAIASGRRVSVG